MDYQPSEQTTGECDSAGKETGVKQRKTVQIIWSVEGPPDGAGKGSPNKENKGEVENGERGKKEKLGGRGLGL